MTEHIHRCLSCMPDMVPDFSRDDPRYHDAGKCRPSYRSLTHVVTLDGDPIGYTSGHFEGREGWVLFAGKTIDDIHPCSCADRSMGRGMTCLEPRFGVVTSEHRELD